MFTTNKSDDDVVVFYHLCTSLTFSKTLKTDRSIVMHCHGLWIHSVTLMTYSERSLI